MNNFIVSARKYRPSTFSTVVGQESITSTLKNSIKLNHLAHAYLFCGPRGVGKTTCARIFAKTINCQNITDDFEACNECESCQAFEKSSSFNIHELDAASNNSVDDIRNLIDQVRIPPQIGKYSIYIIDEVHMLSQQAFNAFLKTLEEPPAHAIFILATTEKHKIIPTILSRCQIFDFKRIKINDITKHLKFVAESENITAEENALHTIAEKADGALRDALSIFDQIVSFSGNNITYDSVLENLNVLDYRYYFNLTDNLLESNIHQTLLIFNEILDRGFNITYFINGLSEHLRNILVCKDSITVNLLDVSENQKNLFIEFATKTPKNFILKALNILNNVDINYKSATNKRLFVEIALMKLCSINDAQENNQPINKTPIKQPEQKTTQTQEHKPNIQSAPENKPANEQKNTTAEIANKDTKTSPEIKTNEKESKPYTAPPKTDTPIGKLISEPTEAIASNNNNTSQSTQTNEIKNKEFTIDKFNKAWDKLMQNYDTRIKTILEEKTFDINSKKLTISVKSTNTQKDINSLKPEILSFLQKHLENNQITIETKLLRTEEIKIKKPYTDAEKFNHLAKQNKALIDLKIKFDLDV